MTSTSRQFTDSEKARLDAAKKWLRSKAGKVAMVEAVDKAKARSEKHKAISSKHEKALRSRPVLR